MERGFRATACAKSEQQPAVGGVERSACGYTCRRQRSVYHREALPISALFRLRYPCNLVRGGSHSQRGAGAAARGIEPAKWSLGRMGIRLSDRVIRAARGVAGMVTCL